MGKTFFELKSDFLMELYQLLQLSLDTADFVSPKMANKIEKRIVKGAFKTWSKIYWKHRWKKHFFSLRSLIPNKETTELARASGSSERAQAVGALTTSSPLPHNTQKQLTGGNNGT